MKRDRSHWFRRHAIERAEERFGLSLEPSALSAISEFILSGQSEVVEPEHGGRSVHHLNVNGLDVVVVFDHATQSPVTFLKRSMVVDKLRRKARRKP